MQKHTSNFIETNKRCRYASIDESHLRHTTAFFIFYLDQIVLKMLMSLKMSSAPKGRHSKSVISYPITCLIYSRKQAGVDPPLPWRLVHIRLYRVPSIGLYLPKAVHHTHLWSEPMIHLESTQMLALLTFCLMIHDFETSKALI